jgi:hypothetical protein
VLGPRLLDIHEARGPPEPYDRLIFVPNSC